MQDRLLSDIDKLKNENASLKEELKRGREQIDFLKLMQRDLIAHALLVSADRPVHDEDGEFLGHWQDDE